MSIYQDLEKFGASYGEMRAMLSAHPLRRGYITRIAAQEASASVELEGLDAEPLRLLAAYYGMPVRRYKDYGGLSLGLELLGRIDRGDEGVWRTAGDILKVWKSKVGGAPDLIQVADLLRSKDDPAVAGPAGRLAAWLILSGRTRGQYWSLSAALRGVPHYRSRMSAEEGRHLIVSRIAVEAERSSRELMNFLVEWQRWHKTAISHNGKPFRSNSNIPRLINLASVQGVVSAPLVAKQLKITVPGAHHLIGQLVEAGILTEITSRSSYRAYVTPDLLPMKSGLQRRGRSGRTKEREERVESDIPHPSPALLAPGAEARDLAEAADVDLDQLFRDLDRVSERVANVADTLSRRGSK